MKYVIRRAILGLIGIPVVAGVYLFGYTTLLLAGAEPNATFTEVWNNGILIGVTCAIFLTFQPQFSKFLDKLVS